MFAMLGSDRCLTLGKPIDGVHRVEKMGSQHFLEKLYQLMLGQDQYSLVGNSTLISHQRTAAKINFPLRLHTSSTAQGGGGSFKDRKL